MPTVTTPQGTPPPTNDGMGEAGIPLNFLNSFMIDQRIKNQKAAQERQAEIQQSRQKRRDEFNIGNLMPGIPPVSNAAMVALRSQIPNTPQRGGVEDPVTRLSQDKANKDTKLSDLSRPEYNTLINTLNDKMNPLQASQFGGSLSNDDTVSEVVDKANKVFFDSPVKDYKGFPNDPLTSYNKKSGGGLPTIYRENGGDMDFMSTYTQEDIDEAMAGPTDDGLGDVLGDDGNFDSVTGMPTVTTTTTPIDLSGVETYGGPVYDNRGNIIAGGGTFDPDRPFDTGGGPQPWRKGTDPLGLYYGLGSLPVNIPTTKEGAQALGPWLDLVGGDELREVMARPQGVAKLQAAMKEGKVNQEEFDRIAEQTITLALGATGPGFITYTDDEWYGKNGIDPDAPRKEIRDERDIIDKFKGLVTITGELDKNKVEEMNKTLNLMGGAKFEPHSGLMRGIVEGLVPTPFTVLTNIFGTGEKSVGTITFPSGKTFEVGDKGSITADKDLPEFDYGPDPIPKKPVPKKKKKKILPEEEEEEKKSTPKNNINSPRMKDSNIERLKTYMSLTGKDLSDSKQDLAITDISITEEDFT